MRLVKKIFILSCILLLILSLYSDTVRKTLKNGVSFVFQKVINCTKGNCTKGLISTGTPAVKKKIFQKEQELTKKIEKFAPERKKEITQK